MRDYWIYVPAQYSAQRPACVIVFQDGGGMVAETGSWRVPIVFDNLIHKGELPVIIGVFIDPGVLAAASPSQQNRYNRSFEYDALGDRYARFLTEEILTEVARHYNVSNDPTTTPSRDRAPARSRPSTPHGTSRTPFTGLAASSAATRETGLSAILEPGKDSELLGRGYQLTADSAVGKDGSVYFTDARNNRIYKIDPNGTITVWKEGSGGAHGVAFGPDGRLYAGQHDRKRIVAYTPDGTESVVAEGMQTHQLAVTDRNEVYFADAPNHRVWFVDTAGNKRVVHNDINWPKGVRASTDQSLLAVNDPHTKWVWSFQIQRDGSLVNGQPFYRLETADDSSESDAGGMTFDTEGFLYVATRLGVQVCDQPGRVMAIINPPRNAGVSDVFFGGPDMRWLYVTDGENVYRRPVKRRGAVAWDPVKPPQPRL